MNSAVIEVFDRIKTNGAIPEFNKVGNWTGEILVRTVNPDFKLTLLEIEAIRRVSIDDWLEYNKGLMASGKNK